MASDNPRLHALRREAFALARLAERLRADAARVAGPDPRCAGYRFDVERHGDLHTQDDHHLLWGSDALPVGFADLLRAADAHTLEAERLVARAFGEKGTEEDVLLLDPMPITEPDPLALRAPLPCESDIEDDDESDMSDADA